MQIGARRHARGQQMDKRGLNQATLVMARLWPGIREIEVHTGQAIRGDHVLQHFDGIVLDDAHVGEARRLDALEKRTDACFKHFDAKEVVPGSCQGDLLGGLPHAEPDFQDQRCHAPKGGLRIKRGLRERDRPLIPNR